VGHLQQKQNQQAFILSPKSKSKDDEQHVLYVSQALQHFQISNLTCAAGDWENPTTQI
jgi:hypothetical protein